MKIFQVILTCTLILRNSRGAKNGDEGKPYEFGFTIDGEQHRYEKKDANGIIQGEFGFITADGIYHVTTYATDENGSFRILSMRNVRISDPLDGSGGNYGQKVSAAEVQRGGTKTQQITATQSPIKQSPLSTDLIPPKKENLVVQSTTARASLAFTTQPTIKPACASCGYVTLPPSTQKPQFTQTNQQYNNQLSQNAPPLTQTNQPYNNQISQNVPPLTQTNQPYSNQISQNVPSFTQTNQPYSNQIPQTQPGNGFAQAPQIPQNNFDTTSQGFTAFGPSTAGEGTPPVPPRQQIPIYASQPSPQNPTFLQQPLIPPSSQNAPFVQPPSLVQQQSPLQPQPPQNVDVFAPSSVSTPSLPNTQLSSGLQFPEHNKVDDIKVENGMILVPNNAPIKIVDKYPGMVDGLPTGIEEKDIKDLLYKFNYTIGFHGHYEKGYKDGSKIGGYFVNGRDGISRVVTYVADEYGYRPKFKLVNLGLQSPDTPKEETEKNFGLKSFEFVWYPLK